MEIKERWSRALAEDTGEPSQHMPASEEDGGEELEPIGALSFWCNALQGSAEDAEAKPCERSKGKAKAVPPVGAAIDRVIAKLEARKLARQRKLARNNMNSMEVVEVTPSAIPEWEIEYVRPMRGANNGLMYVDLIVNGKPIRDVVDTGASHNYVSEAEARRLGLTLVPSKGRAKAINSAAQPVVGVAKGIMVKAGSFSTRISLTAVKMKEYDLMIAPHSSP